MMSQKVCCVQLSIKLVPAVVVGWLRCVRVRAVSAGCVGQRGERAAHPCSRSMR